MNEKIEVGDRVEVQVVIGHSFDGTVLYIPCATGDSWHVKDDNGILHYVQTFAQIIRWDTNP